MKKWLTGTFVLIIVMFVAAGLHAQALGKEKGKNKAGNECKAFIDKNNDGICDSNGTDKCMNAAGCKQNCDGKRDVKECSDSCKHKETDQIQGETPLL